MRKSYWGKNRAKKQKFILWCATIFITILGLVCFFVYRQYSSKNTKEISEHAYSSDKVDITGEYGMVSGIFETSWKEEEKKKHPLAK